METVRLSIRDGEIQDAGSWLYVWAPAGSTEVIYVGGTSLPPALRTWLHLHHEDPSVGRVAHRYDGALTESLDVVACRLPDELDRRAAKAELIAQLDAHGILAADYVGDPPDVSDAPEHVRRVVTEVLARVVAALNQRTT